MNKRNWLIPLLIVAVNFMAIIVQWNSLQEIVPAHFDLQGNAAGTMPRNMLLLFPLIGILVCLVSYFISRFKPVLKNGIVVIASGICLVLLFSTMVTLTHGRMPVLMLAEPVVLLAAVAGFIVSVVKARKIARSK